MCADNSTLKYVAVTISSRTFTFYLMNWIHVYPHDCMTYIRCMLFEANAICKTPFGQWY